MITIKFRTLLIKISTGLVIAAALAGTSLQASAALVVHSGTDASGSTSNSDSAYASWLAAVSSSFTDDMTGLSCSIDGSTCSSSAGNSFSNGGSDQLIVGSFTNGVVSGASLGINKPTFTTGNFIWTLAAPSSAFGFNGFDNDAGTVTVNFLNGSAQSFSLATSAGGNESLFWGVSGLSGLVSSVSIGTHDPGSMSYWDNFSTGSTVPLPAVPVPAAVWLFGTALIGFVGMSRRRKVA